MALEDDVIRYYDARAGEYDVSAGYTGADAELLRAPTKARYKEFVEGHDVLEIACGTGYWTASIAETARTVLATDANASVLDIARKRLAPFSNVTCQQADAYSLEGVREGFTAAFGIWWWSHMPRASWRCFVERVHAKLQPGAVVLFVDQLPSAYDAKNRRCEGEDVVEERVVSGQDTYTVLKNFPAESELHDLLSDIADGVQYIERPEEHSWNLTYTVRK